MTEVTEPAPEPEPVTEPLKRSRADGHAAPRRLELSRDDRVIAGVCGGLGEYFGVDAVLIRIAAIVLVFAGGAGLLLYAIGWIAMPEAPEPGTPERPGPQPRRRASARAARSPSASPSWSWARSSSRTRSGPTSWPGSTSGRSR